MKDYYYLSAIYVKMIPRNSSSYLITILLFLVFVSCILVLESSISSEIIEFHLKSLVVLRN